MTACRFLLLATALILFQAAKCHDQEDEVERKCKEKHGVDDRIFVGEQMNEEDELDEFDVTLKDEDNEEHRCYVECLMKGFGYITDEKLNEDFIMEEILTELEEEGVEIEEDELRKDISFCGGQSAEGRCNTSYRIVKCLFNLQKKRR